MPNTQWSKKSVVAALTPAELMVLVDLLEGRTLRKIADGQFRSEAVIRHHRTRIYQVLGVTTRLALSRMMCAAGVWRCGDENANCNCLV